MEQVDYAKPAFKNLQYGTWFSRPDLSRKSSPLTGEKPYQRLNGSAKRHERKRRGNEAMSGDIEEADQEVLSDLTYDSFAYTI